jgi:hypothetical protein
MTYSEIYKIFYLLKRQNWIYNKIIMFTKNNLIIGSVKQHGAQISLYMEMVLHCTNLLVVKLDCCIMKL